MTVYDDPYTRIAKLTERLDELARDYKVLQSDLADAERTWKNQQAITRDEMRRADEYQDAYRAAEADLIAERQTVAEWAHRVNAAEAQRDTLAEALREIEKHETNLARAEDRILGASGVIARAALAEAGLEERSLGDPRPDPRAHPGFWNE